MKCELILLAPDEGKVYSLNDGMAVVGRDAGNDIQLLYEHVSRRHAKLVVSGEGCVLEDMGSSNGTTVNGRKISRQKLDDGDEIKIGNCTLRFHVNQESKGQKEYFVPRQYSDKSSFTTVKMKRAGGFLKSFLHKSSDGEKAP